MTVLTKTLPSFWECYDKLPAVVQKRADKQFEIFIENPRHASLQFKAVGAIWSARVTDGYRALAFREAHTIMWFWIGPHDEYERVLGS